MSPIDAKNSDPIVIVGMSVEAPGGIESPEDLFAAVAQDRDLIAPFPRDRDWPVDQLLALDTLDGWGAVPDAGGFLLGAAEFDPLSFGLSPREAVAMDPQQRVALRTAVRAIENAGVNPFALASPDAGGADSEVGVYFGASINEYGPRASAVNEFSGHRVVGTALGGVSGRISHLLGLTGPAMTVDTACASSLTALPLAANAVRLDECEWAIAGGVCVMGSPAAFFEFAKNNALARDGRCRSYSAGASGTVWGEGVGAVVLERESRARAHGHRIYARLRGTAVNHNGGGAAIVVPSAPAQRRLIERTLAVGGADPSDIDLIEGHGTGTLGDPLELTALAQTYGAARTAEPAWVGSVKSNMGHAQAAAGILGLVKVLQCGRRGVIAPTRYGDDPTDKIDWDSAGLALPTSAVPWAARSGSRWAAVSSFGVSGTNAHAILEMPDSINEHPADDRPEVAHA